MLRGLLYLFIRSEKVKNQNDGSPTSRWPNEFLPARGTLGRLAGVRWQVVAAKVARHYSLVPTICFNYESGCGLLAYVDKDTFEVRKFEGNPAHPGSRGRNCAKGPATHNQIYDPERILYPLKRVGKRGEGKWNVFRGTKPLKKWAQKCEKAGKSATMASCTTSADPVKIILPTAPLPLGALMATTATPIFARRARALVIGFGALLTDRV